MTQHDELLARLDGTKLWVTMDAAALIRDLSAKLEAERKVRIVDCEAIRALAGGRITCSDDLPKDQRPSITDSRQAFGCVYELIQRAIAAESRLATVFERTRERAAKVCDQKAYLTRTRYEQEMIFECAVTIRALQPEGEESVAAQAQDQMPVSISPEPAPAADLIPGLEQASSFCRNRIEIYKDATTIPFAVEHLHEAQIILELCTAEIERLK